MLQENQENLDPLGCLENQGCRESQDQMLFIVELETQDHQEQKAKWVFQEEEVPKEKKETRGFVPVNHVLQVLQALQDVLGDMAGKETQDHPDSLEKKVSRDLLVLKDLQDYLENLVPRDLLAAREKRGIWLFQDLKGTKEKKVPMGSQDFQDSKDNLVRMDMKEKREIQDPQGIMKMQHQVTKGFLGLQGFQEKQVPEGHQEWDIQVHLAKEDHQELQATQDRGDLKA